MTGKAILSQKYLRQDSFTSSILQVKGHNLCARRVHCTLLVLCLMWRHRRVRNLRIWRALYTTESLFDVTSQESTQPASLLCKLLHMRVGAPPAAWVLLICFGIAAHTTNVCCMLLLTPHCHTHYHTHCHTHSIVCSSSPKSSVAKQKEPTNHFREASMYYYWERYFISSMYSPVRLY